jgi:protoheme IX farnesyltransferase
MLRECYLLTKPGIIYGNALTAIAGLLLASRWHISAGLFLATVAGTCLVIASACVINNYLDRGIDKKMVRTKQRALVTGELSGTFAIIYGLLLGGLGFTLLALFTNKLVVLIGAVAYVDYIVLYGVSKRASMHGTLVGSIAGAAPPVAGYCAVTGHFNGGALIIFLIMVCWQMVHFYAIAIRRSADYKAAGIPVLPLVKGVHATKVQMISYTAAFVAAVTALTLFGYAGYIFLITIGGAGCIWLYKGLTSFQVKDNVKWAGGMFGYSLVVLLVFSAALATGSILP